MRSLPETAITISASTTLCLSWRIESLHLVANYGSQYGTVVIGVLHACCNAHPVKSVAALSCLRHVTCVAVGRSPLQDELATDIRVFLVRELQPSAAAREHYQQNAVFWPRQRLFNWGTNTAACNEHTSSSQKPWQTSPPTIRLRLERPARHPLCIPTTRPLMRDGL